MWGCGGVGCNIIVEHAHMVDSRQQMGCDIIVELAYMVDATQEMGGVGVWGCGGVGVWVVISSLNMHTWSILGTRWVVI